MMKAEPQSHQRRRHLESEMRRAGRLPPGQAATLKFPVVHMGSVPVADLAVWDLRVFGAVERPQRWDWEAFNALPRSRVTMDLHCVTRWSRFDVAVEGVSLKALVEQGAIRPRPAAGFLRQHCENGFTVNLPLSAALQPNFLLATHIDGEPLSPEHGYPLRGVIGAIAGVDGPVRYLWKGGKWLRGLEFLSHDCLGYWERIGFHNGADVWLEQRWSPNKNVL